MTAFTPGKADLTAMRAALALARRGLGNVWPNPAVGCVIARDGKVVGRGWTRPGGRPHAETEALARAGGAARGATAYVTLQPCSPWGPTPARAYAHLLRATHDAILVGTETVLADDPQLTCRLPGLAGRSPVRVAIDRQLRIPPGARIIAEARSVPTWLVTLRSADPERQQALRDAGVDIIAADPDAAGQIDLAMVLGLLGERGLTRLLVEGGRRLAASLLRGAP